MSLEKIRSELRVLSSAREAKILRRFFKTGPGEYGQGDIFIGVKVPQIRKVANKYKDLVITDTVKLLRSAIHEERLAALLVLSLKFKNGNDSQREKIYKIYIGNTKYINNWDLVDLSAGQIVGAFLSDKDRGAIRRFAVSSSLWDRRISIISTFYYIKNNQFEDTLEIAGILMDDVEDLIHKAVGWMLRELGKRDVAVLEDFLKKHYKNMPRTTLRYAIEKFPESKRKAYLRGSF